MGIKRILYQHSYTISSRRMYKHHTVCILPFQTTIFISMSPLNTIDSNFPISYVEVTKISNGWSEARGRQVITTEEGGSKMPTMMCDDRFSGSTSSWWSSGTPCTTPTGTTYTSCLPTRLGLDHLQHHLVGERLAHHHVHVDQRELPDSRVQLEGAGSDLI